MEFHPNKPDLTEEEARELGCTCYDENPDVVCPILQEPYKYKKNEYPVITDNDLVGEFKFTSHVFICPDCKKESVVYNNGKLAVCMNTVCLSVFTVLSESISRNIKNKNNEIRKKMESEYGSQE